MNQTLIRSVSVIVDEFDIVRTSLPPDETDTPLGVDTNTVLSSSVTDQALQPVTRRYLQIRNFLGRVGQLEFPKGLPLNRPIDAPDVLLLPDMLGISAAERSDHVSSV
ncbi:hypothetical protein [Corynebacterium meridianum]|uniref:hypothetical protein n=1 Tax=Corynebacterium meridianum TaxID=2765363 RepID=UPI003D08CADD